MTTNSLFYVLFFGGNDPSPPRQAGDGSMNEPPPSCVHCVGVFATIDKAWIGPFNSSAKIVLIRRCRPINVGMESKAGDTITTLKCVSELRGLYQGRKKHEKLLNLQKDIGCIAMQIL
jgi:hypothetical protein